MPIKNQDLENYYKKTNINMTKKDQDILNNLRNALEKKLTNKNSDISKALQNLSNEQKIFLLSSLFSGNAEKILKCFKELKLYKGSSNILSPLEKLGFDEITLKRIQEHVSKDKLLNSTIFAFTKAILKDNSSSIFSFLSSSDSKKALLYQNKKEKLIIQALQNIPDSELPVKLKFQIANECGLKERNFRPMYSNSLSIKYEPEKHDVSKLSESEFLKILKLDMDMSQFIILASKIIKSKLNADEANPIIKKLHLLYSQYKNTECLDYIEKTCVDYKEQMGETGEGILKKIHKLSIPLKYKNDSRRFYETRLSQYALANDIDLAPINNVLNYFNNNSIIDKSEIEFSVPFMIDTKDEEVFAQHEKYKKLATNYSSRYRVQKEGFYPRALEIEHNVEGDSVYSRNPGILTSTAPNYRDNIIEEGDVRNRTPDIYKPRKRS